MALIFVFVSYNAPYVHIIIRITRLESAARRELFLISSYYSSNVVVEYRKIPNGVVSYNYYSKRLRICKRVEETFQSD